MSAGLQVYTSTGLFQIDGVTPGYALRQHSTVSTSNSTGNYFGSLSFTGVAPLVAIYSGNGVPVACIQMTVSGSTWTALFWSTAATTFDVYVFDSIQALSASGSTFGLQVFDGSGNIVADSALGFCSILDTPSGTVTASSASTQQFSYGVSKVATVCALNAFQYVSQTITVAKPLTGHYYFYSTAWMHSGGTATLNWNQAVSQNGSLPSSTPTVGQFLNWSALMIDVTGL